MQVVTFYRKNKNAIRENGLINQMIELLYDQYTQVQSILTIMQLLLGLYFIYRV